MSKTTSNLNYGYCVVSCIVMTIGIALFLVQKSCSTGSFWYSVYGNIGSALLIGGTLTLLQQIFTKRIEDQKLLELLNISSAISDSGLNDIKTDASHYNFNDLLKQSEEFYVILNDGQRWTNNYEHVIKERFNKKNRITEFYLVDPDGPFCLALANKVEFEHHALQDKINQTVTTLKRAYQGSKKKGGLRIYFLKNYPTQSLYYTEKKIVVTPYQTSSGRNTIPLYEYSYEKGKYSIGMHLYNDLGNVRKESRLIFDNGKEL